FESRSFGIEVKLLEVVQYIDGDVFHFEDLGSSELTRPVTLVHIAAHGGHRSNGAKLLKDFGRADVACVNNAIRSAQRLQRLRPQQAVCVGNDADAKDS